MNEKADGHTTLRPDVPYNPFEHQVVDKKPYPTLSGRITLSRRCSPKGRTTTTTQSRYRTSIQRANEMATGVKRQLGMVMDLNKCIGCHTCTSACKMQWTNRQGRSVHALILPAFGW